MTVDHAQLRTTALAYAALARSRQRGRLNVTKLIEHQRLAAQLCQLTQTPDVAQAWQQTRQLLGDLPQSPTDDQPRQRPTRRRRPANEPVNEPAASSAPTERPACLACAKPLRKKREVNSGVHKGCQLVPCPNCRKSFPRRTLVQGRCLPCAAKAAGQTIPARGFAPVSAEQIAAFRQAAVQQAATRRAAINHAVVRQTAHRQVAVQQARRAAAADPAPRPRRTVSPLDIPQKPLWFGRIMRWSTKPGWPGQLHARYDGVDYVMERVGRRTADQRGVAAGWYLRRPDTAWDQYGDHLAENMGLAKRLAEVLIVTGESGCSAPDQPPNLVTVMHGDLTSRLSIAGTATSVVIAPDLDQPMVRVHRHAPLSDPYQDAGGLLGEIRAKIQRPAGDRAAPVSLGWTVHTAAGKTVSTHASWDDAFSALAALLEGTTTREALKDARCTKCGNHGAHMCGKDWRLANGKITKRPRGGSVRAVTGGLPGLGGH
ncbi:hypothetical protein [Kutzneria buriramensis]|uniref:Uncharacterized protein n=1 Tax=Kutzneria buriramensis TaxID=1045776 RepID=A0A3E0G5A9_9PSEU|nr:hypothetical protein [Kutzneria buriramensis]REH18031.1 hypothetical protein BCF44_13818 [Kutzneria buriramensis]